MEFIPNSAVFALGVAVGVLGLLLLFSLIIARAYDELTLLFLAAYISIVVLLMVVSHQLQIGEETTQSALIILGPSAISALLMRLFRKRTSDLFDKIAIVVIPMSTLALLGVLVGLNFGVLNVSASVYWPWLCLAWGAFMGAGFAYRSIQALETAGPWKWWLMFGHAAGLVTALLFLVGVVSVGKAYLPVTLMLLVQVPPIYLALVWRSRLLNESRLRSTAADVTDPLTGLATTPVLVERLMRITSRANQSKLGQSSSALFIIHVQNWTGLLNELGPEFNEKLLLEAALRLRRSIGDNDLVARISGGRFAVVAQGLINPAEISAMATRMVVSGLRIDSPLLPGVELQFRVILRPLTFAKPLPMAAVKEWLASLAALFDDWPRTHRSRSILVVQGDSSNPVIG
ncbi:MAG: diguanylate cyclase [Pseudomonadota bacterium]